MRSGERQPCPIWNWHVIEVVLQCHSFIFFNFWVINLDRGEVSWLLVMLKVFSWSLFVFWLLIRPALEANNHTSLNRIPSRWILASQITQLGISGSDWNRKCFATRTRAGYAKSRISYYNNCSATFNYQYLRLSGDISPNPGSKSTRICTDCGRAVARNHRATRCDDCSSWTHIKCGGVLPKEYHHMKSQEISHTHADPVWHYYNSFHLRIRLWIPVAIQSWNQSQRSKILHQCGLNLAILLKTIV